MTFLFRKRTSGRGQGGTLMLIAILLIGSAVLRTGLEAGPALGRDAKAPSDLGRHDAQADSGQQQASEDYHQMLLAFQEREDAIRKREIEIEDRMKALSIADQAIEVKLEALVSAEERLRTTLALADGAVENDIKRLIDVYEKMKPKDAALLFEEMDPNFAAGFLARMKPEAAAGILAGLNPQAAYALSVVLASRNAEVPKN